MDKNNKIKSLFLISMLLSIFAFSFSGLSLMNIPQNGLTVIPPINASSPKEFGTSQNDPLLSLDMLTKTVFDQKEWNIENIEQLNIMKVIAKSALDYDLNDTMIDAGSTFTNSEINIKCQSNNIVDLSSVPTELMLLYLLTSNMYAAIPEELKNLLFSTLTDGLMPEISDLSQILSVFGSIMSYIGFIPQGTEEVKTSFDLTVNNFEYGQNYTLNGFSVFYIFIQSDYAEQTFLGGSSPISMIRLNFLTNESTDLSSLPDFAKSIIIMDNSSMVLNLNILNETEITEGTEYHIDLDLLTIWKEYFKDNGYLTTDPVAMYSGFIIFPFSLLWNDNWMTSPPPFNPAPWVKNAFNLDISIKNYTVMIKDRSIQNFPLGTYEHDIIGTTINEYGIPPIQTYPESYIPHRYYGIQDKVGLSVDSIKHNATITEPWITVKVNETQYTGIDFANYEIPNRYDDFKLIDGGSSYGRAMDYSDNSYFHSYPIFINQSIYGRDYLIIWDQYGITNTKNLDTNSFISSGSLLYNLRGTTDKSDTRATYNRTYTHFRNIDDFTYDDIIPLYPNQKFDLNFNWEPISYGIYGQTQLGGNYTSSLGVLGIITQYNNQNYTVYYLWGYNKTITHFISNSTYSKYLLIDNFEIDDITWDYTYTINIKNITGVCHDLFAIYPQNITSIMPATWIFYESNNVTQNAFRVEVYYYDLNIKTSEGKAEWNLYELDALWSKRINENSYHMDYEYDIYQKDYLLDWNTLNYMEITIEDTPPANSTSYLEFQGQWSIWNNKTETFDKLFDVNEPSSFSTDKDIIRTLNFNNPKDYVISQGEEYNTFWTLTGFDWTEYASYDTIWLRNTMILNSSNEIDYFYAFNYYMDYLNYEFHTEPPIYFNHTIDLAPNIKNLKVFVNNIETSSYTYEGQQVSIDLQNWYNLLNTSRTLYNSLDPTKNNAYFIDWQTPFIPITYQYEYNITMSNFQITQTTESLPTQNNGTYNINYDISFVINHEKETSKYIHYTFSFRPPDSSFITHKSLTANGTTISFFNPYETKGWLSGTIIDNKKYSYPIFRVGLKYHTIVSEKVEIEYNMSILSTRETWLSDIVLSSRNRTYAFKIDTDARSYILQNISLIEPKIPTYAITSVYSGLGRIVSTIEYSGGTIYKWNELFYNETEVLQISYIPDDSMEINVLDNEGNQIGLQVYWELYIENTNLTVAYGLSDSNGVISISDIIPETYTLIISIDGVIISEKHYIDLSYNETYDLSIKTYKVAGVSVIVTDTTMMFIGIAIGAGAAAGIFVGYYFLVLRKHLANKIDIKW